MPCTLQILQNLQSDLCWHKTPLKVFYLFHFYLFQTPFKIVLFTHVSRIFVLCAAPSTSRFIIFLNCNIYKIKEVNK